MTNTYTVQLDKNPQALLQKLTLQIKKDSYKLIPMEIREQLPLNSKYGTIVYAALLLLQKEVNEQCQIETEKDQDKEVQNHQNVKVEENKEIVNSHGGIEGGEAMTGTYRSLRNSPPHSQ